MLRNLRILFLISLLGLLTAGLTNCGQKEEAKEVKLNNKEISKKEEISPEKNPLRIALGAMLTPKEGFIYYKQLLDYIEEKSGRPVKFVDKTNYTEINALLKSRNIDLAFVCSGPYVKGHDEFGLELLVAPQAYGAKVYYSYIIAHIDSPVKKFDDLRGKIFCFTDPVSNSGALVPKYMLAKMNETPDSFFKKFTYTYTHDKSIQAVAQKVCDGAAVDSLIWEYTNKTNPKFTSKTKIVLKSPPYGIPPVVIHPGIDPELKKKLREILLKMHKDKRGKEILKGMMVDKFVLPDDSEYNSIREMENWTVTQSSKK